MPTLDRTKYDVELNGQGFMVGSVVKDSAPDFVPRFNTGEQGENDLDLLKSKSIDTYQGGMLQNYWQDDDMAYSLKNVVFNPLDKYLYPSPEKEEQDTWSYGSSFSGLNYGGKCVIDGVVYYSRRIYSSGFQNQIRAWNGTTEYDLTMPALLRDASAITDMKVYRNKIYIATGNTSGSVGVYALTPNATTPSSGTFATHGTLQCKSLAVLADNLYGIKPGGGIYINSTGTTWAFVKNAGQEVSTTGVNDICVFQRRLYIAKTDGLYAYDGVSPYVVLNTASESSTYKKIDEYRGFLYIIKEDGLARFNSVTYEELYDFSGIGTFVDMEVANGRLYLLAEINREVSDTGSGKPGSSTLTATYALFYYDGVGLFLYDQFQVTDLENPTLIAFEKEIWAGFNPDDITLPAYIYKWDPEKEFAVDDENNDYNKVEIVTSIHDAGYPNVAKVLHTLELDQLVDDDTNIQFGGIFYVKTKDEHGEWTDWTSVGQVTSSDDNKVRLYPTLEYYEMQIKFLSDISAATWRTINKRISFRYTLQPRRRYRWQLDLLYYGYDLFSPQILRDNSEVSVAPKDLREKIYSAYEQLDPFWFVDVDSTKLNDGTGINDTDPTITVDSTAMFPESGTLRIGSEIIRYDSKTATTFNAVERGAYGTTATSHSDDAVVEPIFQVYMDRIIQDRYVLDELTTSRGDETQGLQGSALVQLVEV